MCASQAQASLQQLFQLVPVTWTLVQHVQSKSGNQSPAAQGPNVMDLTGDEPAEHAEHDSLLWLSLVLEWGPLCVAASVMCWAEAIQKVLDSCHHNCGISNALMRITSPSLGCVLHVGL